jgi:hypothetical protein
LLTLTGIAITAVLYFTDFYYINVKGYATDIAGIQLLYYTPGIGSKEKALFSQEFY